MRQKLVAFVVGHENWGKSHTLAALKRICGAQRRDWYVTLDNVSFRVHAMSNDDIPRRYENFIDKFSGDYLIAALCPKFLKLKNYKRPNKTVDKILQSLKRRRYTLIFWVIKHKWSDPTRFICQEEVSELRKYGDVKVLEEIRVKDRVRAKRFREFVLNAL